MIYPETTKKYLILENTLKSLFLRKQQDGITEIQRTTLKITKGVNPKIL